MATVTGLTATRMLQIEDASVVNARLDNGNLVLTKQSGLDINVGNVVGPVGPTSTVPGPTGPTGPPGPTGPEGPISSQNTDASLLSSGTLSDARLPSGSNAAAVASKAPLNSPAFTGTPTGITKSHVGLSNVDNTSDASKPVSTAQATAIALKMNLIESSNTVASSGGTQTIPDTTSATLNVITLSAACTFTFPAAATGKSFTLVLKSGGAFAVTWPGTVKWSGGAAPSLTSTPGKFDVLSFACVDGTNWLGFVGGKNF